MKKELLNEILKFKLLSKYETKNTFTENVNGILEQKGALQSLAKDTKYLKNLESELPLILKKTGPLGPGGTLKTVDDVMLALKTSSISVANLGKLNFGILRTSKNPSLRKTAAEWVVSQKTFGKTFSSGNSIERLTRLKQLNPNMSDDIIRDLHVANELRLKNLGKSGKNLTKKSKGAEAVSKKGQNVSQTVTVNVNTAKEAEQFAKTYGRDFDDLAKQNGHSNFESWMRQSPDDAYRAMRNQSKSGKGVFGKIVDWGKKSIKWRTLWGLAKIAGVSYLVWWAFFKEDGFKVECETGEHFEEGKGCIADKKTDNDKIEGGGGGGGDTIVDSEGNKYQECESPYYKGCVNKKGNTDIKEVQDCLGVTPNGFFNKETEDALYNKINKKSFSPSDISTICAKSYGSSGFQL